MSNGVACLWHKLVHGGCSMSMYFRCLTTETSFRPDAHTNLAATVRFVARIDGCERPCTASKMVRCHVSGTRGLGRPVEMSQQIESPLSSSGLSRMARPAMAVRTAVIPSSVRWAATIAFQSTTD